jgi:hypothetical protein
VAPSTPVGPVGTVYRPPAQIGTVVTRPGLRLALVTGDNPLASVGGGWAGWRCLTLVCTGFRVR